MQQAYWVQNVFHVMSKMFFTLINTLRIVLKIYAEMQVGLHVMFYYGCQSLTKTWNLSTYFS